MWHHRLVTESTIGVPPALLNAVASRSGRVTLVVGAGCSVEHPTSLHLARTYSRRVHDDLVADGVIEPGDCAEPEDLSLLASTVFARTGSQAAVVKRLPHNDFRLARANNGYLLAAALMCEGSVGIVASLNYDLAMSDALRQLDERGVDEIAGPSGLQFLGTKAIIYLHRNVNEQDEERWILRKEALDDEWRNNWESVVANRIAASPVVVFAGLGSPAAVLTETVGRVRGVVPNMLE